MISQIQIQNYKSITHQTLDLGRVNVFIGENGSGKSNILEAIALAAAAAGGKLDSEFLASRGIRTTSPQKMRPAFCDDNDCTPITVAVRKPGMTTAIYEMQNANAPYSKWQLTRRNQVVDFKKFILDLKEASLVYPDERSLQLFRKSIRDAFFSIEKIGSENGTAIKIDFPKSGKFMEILQSALIPNNQIDRNLAQFIIYSPENSSLRTAYREGQIEPLGINGEGVFRLLSLYLRSAGVDSVGASYGLPSESASGVLASIKSSLQMLDWFDDLRLAAFPEESLEVKDRFLASSHAFLDYSSANEGFLFLLFYFLLLSSDLTPPFFAIDNIDASLNPKLCERLIIELVHLSKLNGKQLILTTHNPAVLDGLDLNDDDQRLFIISRSGKGETRIKRFKKAVGAGSAQPRMSELFLRGMIGGLPKSF